MREKERENHPKENKLNTEFGRGSSDRGNSKIIKKIRRILLERERNKIGVKK